MTHLDHINCVPYLQQRVPDNCQTRNRNKAQEVNADKERLAPNTRSCTEDVGDGFYNALWTGQ